MKPLLAFAVCLTTCVVAYPATARVQVVINNLDGPGEGFNDPTAILPAGGNAATTLGAARIAAFRVAAGLWGNLLSPRPGTAGPIIEVDARFDSMTCTMTNGVLGSAGSGTVHRDFPGAPIPGTFYPQALANVLAGDDLAPGVADIVATFNSDVDDPTCLGSTSWYYGFDAHPPSGAVDLVTIVLHELAHGLGFESLLDLTSGALPMGAEDAFTLHLAELGVLPSAYPLMSDAQRLVADQADPNLVWVGSATDAATGVLTAGKNGGHVRMFGPGPPQPGSSLSHFSPATTPNQVMEPAYSGPNHDPGLALSVLYDVGWPDPTSVPAMPSLASVSALALLIAGIAAMKLGARRRPLTDT